MTDSNTPRQQQAFDLYQQAISLVKQQSTLFLDIGETFKKIRDNKMYQYMGEGGFDTWEQFLSQPDIYLAPQTVRAHVHIFDVFIDKLKLDRELVSSVPFYKLNLMVSLVKDMTPGQAEITIYSLKELGAKDFNDELRKLKGLEPEEVKSKKDRESESLDLLFKEFTGSIEKARDTDQVLGCIQGFKGSVMSWHKKFKT